MQIDSSHELTPARKQKTYLTPPPLAREANPGAVQAQRPGFCIFGSRSRDSGKWNGKKAAKQRYQVGFSKIT